MKIQCDSCDSDFEEFLYDIYSKAVDQRIKDSILIEAEKVQLRPKCDRKFNPDNYPPYDSTVQQYPYPKKKHHINLG